MDNAFPTDLNEENTEKTQLQLDEELALLLHNEYINELRALDEDYKREYDMMQLRKKQNEENARLRIEQDMAYLESLRVIPKNTVIETPVETDANIPPQPPPEPEIAKPPQHYICPITNKLINNGYQQQKNQSN